jgi:hypothetical protein
MQKIVFVVGLLLLKSNIGFTQEVTLEKNNFLQSTSNIKSDNELNIDVQRLYKVEKRNIRQFVMPSLRIINISSEPIMVRSKVDTKNFPNSFQPILKLGIERKQALAFIYIPQYIKKENGSIEKLTQINYELVEGNAIENKTTGTRAYANNSILANGSWTKIAVNKAGMYKLSVEFLQSISGSNNPIQSNTIRLFGNGGMMLSENNAIERSDDLVENAIKIYDGGDGIVNGNDFVLFYAEGPHAIVKNETNKKFSHLSHLYSDASYYFLSLNLVGSSSRVQNGNNPNSGNINVNTFDEFQFYEKDLVNLGKFGKTWWGPSFDEGFGANLSQDFLFEIPNIETTSPIQVITRTGTAAGETGFSTMKISANNQLLGTAQHIPHGSGLQYWEVPKIKPTIHECNGQVLGSPIKINLTYNKGSQASIGYLDYIELHARRNLVFNGYLNFADWESVGNGNISTYFLTNVNANVEVWDITNPLQPKQMSVALNGNNLSFSQNANELHRFVAFDASVTSSPIFVRSIPNQNLHQASALDYLVITNESLKSEAERLAAHHAVKRGYRTKVVMLNEIYNEFSSGAQDVSAIRDYIKMLYDKASINDLPKNVLLFGDASYDYKDRIPNNTNIVPVSETDESVSIVTGYCTDDFFGFLDDVENPNAFGIVNTLDVGIGRLPVSTQSKASEMVNKILLYDSPKSFGPWKNNANFTADNGDFAGHLKDAELMVKTLSNSNEVFNTTKVYVDAFVQESTPAGTRCPEANRALMNQVINGTFLMNYNGHGGPSNWTSERILSSEDINSMDNTTKLPLFITATCDFATFDNPEKLSAGEMLMTKTNGGAIALMTTTQIVFSGENSIMNKDYIQNGFKKNSSGRYPTLGDAYRLSKNETYVATIDKSTAANFRKFVLLGDPGLTLSFPKYQVFTDSINGVSINANPDTIKAKSKTTISGFIADENGQILNTFNGVAYPTIFDKAKKISTLGFDSENPKREYKLQSNAIYKGKVSVKNGRFSYTFVVPKDIDYAVEKGKISYYAENGVDDANGFDKKVMIGGSSLIPITDNIGPIIKAFINNEKFVNGGITNPNSTLILKLFDDNGINFSGNSVGHDITAIIDGNIQKTLVLNNFFEADLDSYQSGIVRFPMNNISEGKHTLMIKVWDVFNNSSEVRLDFEVVINTEGKLAHVYNYPNPFTTKTQFMFEHNMPNQNLALSIDVFSTTGKIVKSIRSSINTPGNRVSGIEWDGKDEFGEKLGKGVYFYKLGVKSANGFSESVLQKLILLQ